MKLHFVRSKPRSCGPITFATQNRILLLVLPLLAAMATRAQPTVLRVVAYYPGYRQSYLTPANIDFDALTHLIHFSVMPNANGTLNTTANGLTPTCSTDLVATAHAAGKKALICVGGASSQAAFQGATASANRAAFIGNLTNFLAMYSYDGVDLDWEPLDAGDASQYTDLVLALRAALNRFSPPRLLTSATAQQPALFSSLQSAFDQINLMTYDLGGPWPGWVTWHNAPIFNGGFRFPSTGGLIPSSEGMVNDFLAAGVATNKLAIGIAFYGDVWSGGTGAPTGGATAPYQSWSTAPTVTAIAYFDLMATYFQSNRYHWDTNAQAAYLSIDNTGSANDKFISYDDEHSCQAKVSYARNCGLGGVMIWEIGQGYRATQPAGQRDPLLQAIKRAWLDRPTVTAIWSTNRDIRLSFTSVPLALYRVEWTTNLASDSWRVLTNNLQGTGGILTVSDRAVLDVQTSRFYRVRTPP